MSNTASASQYWKQIAESIGYADEASMWYRLYVTEDRKIAELAKTFGFGTATIARRIGLSGVEKRSRGGALAPSKVAIAINHLDPRYVRVYPPQEIASVVGCSVHSVYRVLKEM
jgi:hypothetical protein